MQFGKKRVSKRDIISLLDKMKVQDGEQVITVETPNGTISFKLKDALIYEGCKGDIVIDSE